MIELVFDRQQVNVSINDKVWQTQNAVIQLPNNAVWELLKFDADHDVKLIDCKIQGCSITHLLLIMFYDNFECCFGHVVPGRSSYLPIHGSYAVFRSQVCSQLANGWFGQQIYQHHDFALDTGIKVSTHHPVHIQDYFSLATGPHWLRKHSHNSPWFMGPDVDLEKLKLEMESVSIPVLPGSVDTDYNWTMRHIKNPDLGALGLFYLSELAKAAGFEHVETLSFNTLGPGGHIGIHRDGTRQTHRQKLYINLDPNDQVFFKFAKGGLVPMNTHRAVWVNTDGFVHAVVNDSAQSRNIVSISGVAAWPCIAP